MVMNKVLIPFLQAISLTLNSILLVTVIILKRYRNEAESVNRQIGRTAVIIHGYMQDVREIIKKSGLVLGVGRVAIETLACGVPVLSVNQKYFGGLVSRENYSFFRKNNFVAYGLESPDEEKLTREAENYFSNIKYWQEEAALLQKHIDEDLNIFNVTKSIVDLYNELIIGS